MDVSFSGSCISFFPEHWKTHHNKRVWVCERALWLLVLVCFTLSHWEGVFFFKLFYFNLCECVWEWAGECRCPWRPEVSAFQKLELQALRAIGHGAGTQTRVLQRSGTGWAFNCWAIFPALKQFPSVFTCRSQHRRDSSSPGFSFVFVYFEGLKQSNPVQYSQDLVK